MEKKVWSNPEIIDLAVHKTEAIMKTSANHDGVMYEDTEFEMHS